MSQTNYHCSIGIKFTKCGPICSNWCLLHSIPLNMIHPFIRLIAWDVIIFDFFLHFLFNPTVYSMVILRIR
eukprot:UN04710